MYACEICKKKTQIGIDSTHRYGGGWSMRGQASKKIWRPNLHTLRIKKVGKTVTLRLCTKCARTEKAASVKLLLANKKPAAVTTAS